VADDRGDVVTRIDGLLEDLNSSVDQICAGYSDAELHLLADFLRRTAHAGRTATDDLAGD
jgi:hypothetical protein